MPTPRRVIVDYTEPGFYHCLSRCVRKAYLCGDGFEHRRAWIRDRLKKLAGIFSIDVASYSILSNHFHVVVRTDPHRARDWDAVEVVRRWSSLYPASVVAAAKSMRSSNPGKCVRPRGPGSGVTITSDELNAAVELVATSRRRVRRLRRRLSKLGEFMKSLKEPIARRANREDGCTGAFWDGRYKSPRLLDDAAVLLGMMYVDLNLVRAALATTPEDSDNTSVQDRIRALRHFQQHLGLRRGNAWQLTGQLPLAAGEPLRVAEDGIWLAPIERDPSRQRDGSKGAGVLPMTLTEYLELVDATGRMVRDGKAGAIPSNLPPILERVGVNVSGWSTFWRGAMQIVGTAVGSVTNLAAEAQRRKRKWVVGTTAVHQPG